MSLQWLEALKEDLKAQGLVIVKVSELEALRKALRDAIRQRAKEKP